jgi:hypothetical protein
MARIIIPRHPARENDPAPCSRWRETAPEAFVLAPEGHVSGLRILILTKR